jgi:hypothetical protein
LEVFSLLLTLTTTTPQAKCFKKKQRFWRVLPTMERHYQCRYAIEKKRATPPRIGLRNACRRTGSSSFWDHMASFLFCMTLAIFSSVGSALHPTVTLPFNDSNQSHSYRQKAKASFAWSTQRSFRMVSANAAVAWAFAQDQKY